MSLGGQNPVPNPLYRDILFEQIFPRLIPEYWQSRSAISPPTGNLLSTENSQNLGSVGSPAVNESEALRYYIESQPQAMQAFNNTGAITDPTALAQQAILARPMNPSFTGQPLMSREVPLGIQGNNGLAYPSMVSTGLLNVPSYTSRYAGTDSGGGSDGGLTTTTGGGLDTYGSNNSLSNGLVGALMGNLSQPSYGITVDNMGTYADQPDFGYGSGMTGVGNPGESDFGGYTSSDSGIGNPGESVGGYTSSDTGVGNPGESYGGYTSADTGVGNPGESDSGGGSSKIVCTAMNQQYGFGSFRNAIWLKYAENNLTKAHEAGYHAIFLPLVDFAFKQGDGKLNMLTRKFLENCARHRSLDLRAEMRGTKRDTIGMIYRSVLEPLCYAVGKFKGY